MKIQNYMETLVKEELERLISITPEFCRCNSCYTDVVTYALNHLPPKYTSSEIGRAVVSVEGTGEQLRAKITVVLLDAMKVVSQNPNHAI